MPTRKPILLTKAIDEFIHYLKSKERSKETERGYNIVLQNFKTYIEKEMNGQVYVDEITVNHMEDYLSYRKEQGDQPITRNKSLYIFRSFFNYLVRKDHVERNISLNLEPIQYQQKERVYLLPEEMVTLIDAVDHVIVKSAVITMANTGLRVSELCHLTLVDVDLTNWRSLDTYMRRKGFTWDSSNQTYVPATTRIDTILEELSSNTPIKAEMIIKRFEEMGDDSDPRAIATEFGFHDHHELGEYMESKQLFWNSETNNYDVNTRGRFYCALFWLKNTEESV